MILSCFIRYCPDGPKMPSMESMERPGSFASGLAVCPNGIPHCVSTATFLRGLRFPGFFDMMNKIMFESGKEAAAE